MKDNKFTPLTDEMYDLFLACLKSGFTDEQAFELTKSYCSVAFVNQALVIKEQENARYSRYVSKREALNRYKNKTESTTE